MSFFKKKWKRERYGSQLGSEQQPKKESLNISKPVYDPEKEMWDAFKILSLCIESQMDPKLHKKLQELTDPHSDLLSKKSFLEKELSSGADSIEIKRKYEDLEEVSVHNKTHTGYILKQLEDGFLKPAVSEIENSILEENFDDTLGEIRGVVNRFKQTDLQYHIPPGVLFIREEALSKIFAYASLLTSAILREKDAVEISGYLLGYADKKDGIIEEAILAPVIGTHGTVRVTTDSIAKVAKELEKTPYRVVGYWHVHPRMSVFYSSTDNEEKYLILDKTFAKTVYKDDEYKYAASFVVNEKHEIYAEMLGIVGQLEYISKKCPIKVLDGGVQFRINDLIEDLREKVTPSGYGRPGTHKKKQEDFSTRLLHIKPGGG